MEHLRKRPRRGTGRADQRGGRSPAQPLALMPHGTLDAAIAMVDEVDKEYIAVLRVKESIIGASFMHQLDVFINYDQAF